jgi:hypothetical protein
MFKINQKQVINIVPQKIIRPKSCRSLNNGISIFSVLLICNFFLSSCVDKVNNGYNYIDFDKPDQDSYQSIKKSQSTSFSNPYDFPDANINDQDQYYIPPKAINNNEDYSHSVWDIK